MLARPTLDKTRTRVVTVDTSSINVRGHISEFLGDTHGLTDEYADQLQKIYRDEKESQGWKFIDFNRYHGYVCHDRCPGNGEATSGLVNIYKNDENEYLLCVQRITREHTGIHTSSIEHQFLEVPISVNSHIIEQVEFALYDDLEAHFGPWDSDYFLHLKPQNAEVNIDFPTCIFSIPHDFSSIKEVDIIPIVFTDDVGNHISCKGFVDQTGKERVLNLGGKIKIDEHTFELRCHLNGFASFYNIDEKVSYDYGNLNDVLVGKHSSIDKDKLKNQLCILSSELKKIRELLSSEDCNDYLKERLTKLLENMRSFKFDVIHNSGFDFYAGNIKAEIKKIDEFTKQQSGRLFADHKTVAFKHKLTEVTKNILEQVNEQLKQLSNRKK